MVNSLRAVYENGVLRPLEPVNFDEGQEVHLIVDVQNERERVRTSLGDLVAHWPDPSDDSDAYLEEQADELAEIFTSEKSISDIIIEDRGEL